MPSREYHEQIWQRVAPGLVPSHFAVRRAFLLGHVSAGQRALDVGCGEAHFTAELAYAGLEVVGIDVAEEPLRRARLGHPELDLRLIHGEAAWPLPDAGFDVVWAGEVIEHVADTAAWMSELRRVLRPRGTLLLSTPAHGALLRLALALSGRAFAAHFNPVGDHLRFYTQAMLTQLLLEFGFEQVSVGGAGHPAWSRPLLLGSAVRSRF